jgi:peroxiredoxin Q/BCP
LRDQAQQFDDAGCRIVGISFDTPAENAAFKEKFDLPFPLLSDENKAVGTAYQVLRASDDPFADFPQRISYLIDPEGVIQKAYAVTDPAGHATEVLADLTALLR